MGSEISLTLLGDMLKVVFPAELGLCLFMALSIAVLLLLLWIWLKDLSRGWSPSDTCLKTAVGGDTKLGEGSPELRPESRLVFTVNENNGYHHYWKHISKLMSNVYLKW